MGFGICFVIWNLNAMPNFYVYFISSLPVLRFGQKPPFSCDVFLSKCAEFIPEKDFNLLKNLSDQAGNFKHNTTIKLWLDFEVMLKNELVKVRAGRKKIDPLKYLRADGYAGPSMYHIALAAARNPSPLEGERYLDEARWNYLDELTLGHYFDLDFLIIYAYKLLILGRWERIEQADKEKVVNEIMAV